MKQERQLHGFKYEKNIILKFNLIKSDNYTSIWDAYTLSGYPVSIKLEKRGSDIELGDFFRNINCHQDFYLVVGFWKNTKTNITEEKILFIPWKEWHSLFDDTFINPFKELLNNISNLKEDDDKWKKQISQFRNDWKNKTKNLIRPRFKRDHKRQKRIQCAINNKDFYKYFLYNYEISEKEFACLAKPKAMGEKIN